MAILDTRYAAGENAYSDGAIEGELLEYFSRAPVGELPTEFASWAHRYHLSPQRHSLFSWYDFGSEASLIEVGAGLGALTGLFCQKVRSVVALELTKTRSEIIHQRHKAFDNLIVIGGNFAELTLDSTFDYAICVGMLEYAGRYFEAPNGQLSLLKRLRKTLKPGGKLLLAIENRYGLKYWSGSREDHTGRYFDSIEGYPLPLGARTFGRTELQQLLVKAGFSETYFYYPLPDYKLPIEVFSDDYLPTPTHPLLSGLFPFNDPSRSREYLFDERLAVDGIIDNRLFAEFANSFLVEAKSP